MIIIHAKGDNKIGIGNLSRCYELIIYLKKKHEVLGIFECSLQLFKRYAENNIIQSTSSNNSLKILKENTNAIYICDLIAPNKKYSDLLKNIGIKKIMYFNSLENGFQPDILFLTDDFDYSFKVKELDLYRGFKYYIIGEQIVNNRKSEFIPSKFIKNILICFGGADPALFTEYFTEIIRDDKYNYTIVLGPAMSQERQYAIKSIKKYNIKYITDPSDMIDLYNKHDLLITLGGMMTYEAMCLGLPVCAVRWNYLEYIVKSFGKKNMINDLGNIDNAYNNILNLDLNTINKTALNAFNIIDGSALSNIEKVIEKYL